MAKLLYYMDLNHSLLVAVSSVKYLDFNQEDSDEDEDDSVLQCFFFLSFFCFPDGLICHKSTHQALYVSRCKGAIDRITLRLGLRELPAPNYLSVSEITVYSKRLA